MYYKLDDHLGMLYGGDWVVRRSSSDQKISASPSSLTLVVFDRNRHYPNPNMGNFRWANVEKFISLVNLLSMRNGGQVVPSTRKEDEEDDASWEDDSTAQLHLSGREDELKQKFLDRFAELLSRDKGGKYVCCVALRESGSQNIDDDAKVSLLVTRNKAFEGLDRKFCGAVQKLLTTLSESVGKALSVSSTHLCLRSI